MVYTPWWPGWLRRSTKPTEVSKMTQIEENSISDLQFIHNFNLRYKELQIEIVNLATLESHDNNS